MEIKEIIKKAVEGGYPEPSHLVNPAVIFMDSDFWSSLGKSLGWEENVEITMHFGGGSLYLVCHKCKGLINYGGEIGSAEVGFPGTPEQQKKPREELEIHKTNHLRRKHWLMCWHRFIDHLAENKDAESFFKQF